MSRSLLAGLCLLIVGCGDSPVEPASFDGTITAIFVVTGVFGGPNDYTFVVDQDPSSVNPSDPCADQARVHLSPTTAIRWSDALDVQVSPEEVGGKVRVLPGEPTGTDCSRRIEATSIVIVR